MNILTEEKTPVNTRRTEWIIPEETSKKTCPSFARRIESLPEQKELTNQIRFSLETPENSAPIKGSHWRIQESNLPNVIPPVAFMSKETKTFEPQQVVQGMMTFTHSASTGSLAHSCREEASREHNVSNVGPVIDQSPLWITKQLLLEFPNLPHGEKASLGSRARMEDRTTYHAGLLTVRITSMIGDHIIPLGLFEQLEPLVYKSALDYQQQGLQQNQGVVFDALEKFDFAAVFDGHGGEEVAHFLSQKLPEFLQESFSSVSMDPAFCKAIGTQTSIDSPLSFDSSQSSMDVFNLPLSSESHWTALKQLKLEDVQKTIKKAFLNMDDNLPDSRNKMVGSTAITALISDLHIIVANVGDSRAVLSRGRKAYPLSRDHKPDEVDEEQRIKKSGGKIWDFNGRRVMGLLAMTRAFGDASLKPFGVFAEPEITVLPRAADDDFMILACDGLWDVISDDEACRLVQRCFNRATERAATQVSCCRVAATVLSRAAFERGSSDNVSVVVIDLRTM
eukprot:g508.t2